MRDEFFFLILSYVSNNDECFKRKIDINVSDDSVKESYVYLYGKKLVLI